MLSLADAEAVLEFWFGELDASGMADAEHEKRWFQGGASFDAEIRQRFLAVHEAVCEGQADEWLSSARGRLAQIIVLDQFSRNMFRGSPRMFECDRRGIELAKDAIARGDDKQVRFAERMFVYMPLMHSENLADQERCVALFEAFRDEVNGAHRERVASALMFAERHREIIRRFGRFPHRNSTLERTSTAAELNFLMEPNSSF
ncbi:MAG: DUF924 family protein [Myxococcota bacterium]